MFNANTLFNVIFVIAVYSYLIFCTAFIAFMLYSFIYLPVPNEKIYDFIIIHGAGLRDGQYVTPLLRQRIEKAVEAYLSSSNPNIKIIVSGGGKDQMKKYLKLKQWQIISRVELLFR